MCSSAGGQSAPLHAAGTCAGLTGGPNRDSYIGADPVKVSKDTKGAQYDASGGAVDDRTITQQLKDAFIPGSSVGNHYKHTKN